MGVEDSSNGIRAAHAAGMTVVAIPNPTYPPKPDAMELAACVADGIPAAHREILALLDGVGSGWHREEPLEPRDVQEPVDRRSRRRLLAHGAPCPDAFGVISRAAPRAGKVAVVIGGGCGHYPAFAGVVGPGLADAAVIGDVFTSPSAEQVYRTAKAVDGGAGVLFSYGNYSGDVMHFGLAARRLAAEGIDSRTVLVTDDVASGPDDARETRRGVAGDFFVFKVAGAAAERGDDLAGVATLAERANDVTRTFGVAFDGCTLPGQSEPLFTVEPNTMELGLGIHGEPGMRTVDAMDAHELADALVDQLLETLPSVGDGRVAVLLNGLGSTPYEDLFITYGRVYERLLDAGSGRTGPRSASSSPPWTWPGCR